MEPISAQVHTAVLALLWLRLLKAEQIISLGQQRRPEL